MTTVVDTCPVSICLHFFLWLRAVFFFLLTFFSNCFTHPIVFFCSKLGLFFKVFFKRLTDSLFLKRSFEFFRSALELLSASLDFSFQVKHFFCMIIFFSFEIQLIISVLIK